LNPFQILLRTKFQLSALSRASHWIIRPDRRYPCPSPPIR